MSAEELAAERPAFFSENVHFTQALAHAVVTEFSVAGDLVLDPFAGYGTTLVVSQHLGRMAVGIELLPERASLIRQRVGPDAVVFEGDARQLDRFEFGTVDLCLTSPPYMSAVDHAENPLTGYATLDGDYQTYRQELLDVFLAVKRCLRPGGYIVINAATLKTGDRVTPLAWDIVRDLSDHLTFHGETYLHWDHPPPFVVGDYCLMLRTSSCPLLPHRRAHPLSDLAHPLSEIGNDRATPVLLERIALHPSGQRLVALRRQQVVARMAQRRALRKSELVARAVFHVKPQRRLRAST